MQLLAFSDIAFALIRNVIFLLLPLGVLVWALIGEKTNDGTRSRRRRRWRWAIAAVVVLLLGPSLYFKVIAPLRYDGPWALAPNWLLIRVVERQGWPALGEPWDSTPYGWGTTATG